MENKKHPLHFSNYPKDHFIFNGEKLTEETIEKTIKHFAEIEQGCIDEVKNGKVKVNDKEKYFKDCEEQKKNYLNRDFKISLTFLQRAYLLQTGKSIGLLP